MIKANMDDFKKEISKGVWVLADASETMKLYITKLFSDEYEEKIKEFQTPQKYIKQGRKIIVVSLTDNVWGGVEIYNIEDIIFQQGSENFLIIRNKMNVNRAIEKIKYEGAEFKAALLETGYLTEEEYSKYINNRELPGVTLNNF